MRRGFQLIIGVAIFLGLGATALGLLAPWLPYLELINHFRPFLLAGALFLTIVALWIGGRRLKAFAGGFLTVTLVLSLVPVASQASRASGGTATLRVVTLNLWAGNTDVESVSGFLRDERADVVLLQEADRAHRALIAALRDIYPHAYCPDRACSLALLSREPWVEVGKADVGNRRPLIVWARFERSGRPIEVIGTHIAWPFHPDTQARHMEWFTKHVASRPYPLIVAGDLNLSPFSWKLNKLLVTTGLRRHLTWRFSWPAHRWMPFVLLDNILTTPDFATVSARTGPRLGSDHLPVIADLALVRR